jgi:exosome complex exonuclease RRP6
MATLLSLFKPTVPPVVKKRAKELLSVITEAVKGSLSSVSSTRGKTQGQEVKTEKVVNDSEKRDDVVMLDTEVQNLERESKKARLDVDLERFVARSLHVSGS